jgi:hypothetical protein
LNSYVVLLEQDDQVNTGTHDARLGFLTTTVSQIHIIGARRPSKHKYTLQELPMTLGLVF